MSEADAAAGTVESGDAQAPTAALLVRACSVRRAQHAVITLTMEMDERMADVGAERNNEVTAAPTPQTAGPILSRTFT